MDCDAMNVINKLNEEFSELQDENIKLKEEIKKLKFNVCIQEFMGFAWNDECFDEEGKHNEQHIYKKIVSTKNCKYCEFKDKPELCDRKAN